MGEVFSFLQTYRGGIFVLLSCLFLLIFMIQWLCWIFGWGRFKPQPRRDLNVRQPIRYLITEAFAKIINEFRHFLALIIIGIFALSLAYSMVIASNSVSSMREAVTTIVASLSGLVGSIIGYYFGESTLYKSDQSSTIQTEAVQGTQPSEGIVQAPPPPDMVTPQVGLGANG